MGGPKQRLVTPAFLVVTLAGLAFFLAAGVTIPVLPQFIEDELSGGSVAVGVGVGAFAFSAVLVRPLAGRIGDRRGRKVLMVAGALTGGVSMVAYGAAPNLVALIALRLGTGVGEALFFVGAATLVNDLASDERRAEAVSYFSVSVYLGIGLGPVIGETMIDRAGFGWAFIVAGCLSLLGSALSLGAKDVPTSPRPADAPKRRLVHPSALGPGAVLCLGLMGYIAYEVFVPLYVDRFDVDSKLLFLGYAAIVMLVRLFGARIPDRIGPSRTGTIGTLGIASGLAIVAAWPTLAGLWLGTIPMAVGMALQYPALMAMAVNNAPDHDRATVVGTFTAFFDFAIGFGGVILGAAAALGGHRGAFATGSILALCGFVLLRTRVAPAAPKATELAPQV